MTDSFWPPIRIYSKEGRVYTGGLGYELVDETVVEIKMPWKRVIWHPADDNYTKRYPRFIFVWHKFFQGHRARWGWN